MERFRLTAEVTLVLGRGDITGAEVDAIVNAANERMLGGGGVDGAIHRAAGPRLREACLEVTEVGPGVRCPVGEARITPGFELRARHVIHTVGPVYRSARHSAPLLTAAYRSSLELARAHGLRSVAFPAISCGAFGYPLSEAATIALETCRGEARRPLEEIHFILFGDEAYAAFLESAARSLEPLERAR